MVKDLSRKTPRKDLNSHSLYAYASVNQSQNTVLDSQVMGTLQEYHLPTLALRQNLRVM